MASTKTINFYQPNIGRDAGKGTSLYSEPQTAKQSGVDESVPAPAPQPKTGGESGSYGGPVLPQQDPNAIYMDEIQKAASEKNYKALLQSDIAAYNLKMNSRKYLNDMLAEQGLGTQGYGTSAHVGVENAAANLYAQNLENYNQAEATALSKAQEREQAEIEKAKQEATESDKQLVQYLTNSDGSDESINGYMDKYGYTLKNGVWVNKKTGEPASAYIQSIVQYAKENGSNGIDYSSINTSTPAGSTALSFLKANASTYQNVDRNGYDSVDGLSRAMVGAQDNSTTKELSEIVGDEINLLREYIDKNGSSADGTLFKLQRGSGHGEAYLVLYVGGKFYIVSSDDREQSGYPVSEKYNSYTGNKVSFVGSRQQ